MTAYIRMAGRVPTVPDATGEYPNQNPVQMASFDCSMCLFIFWFCNLVLIELICQLLSFQNPQFACFEGMETIISIRRSQGKIAHVLLNLMISKKEDRIRQICQTVKDEIVTT